LAEIVIRALHLRMVTIDVLTREPKELLVIGLPRGDVRRDTRLLASFLLPS